MIRLCWTEEGHLYWVEGDFYHVLKAYELFTRAGIYENTMCFLYRGMRLSFDQLFALFTTGTLH